MSSRSAMTLSRRRRRWITFTWTTVLTVIIIALIYWEKTAILYILATLGVVGLLTVVALADLGGRETGPADSGSGPE